MPYDNPYNRSIANTIHNINDRYATLYAFSPVDGRDSGYSQGGSNAGVLFQMGNASKRDGEDNMYNDELNLPPQYFYGNNAESMMNQEMEGGSGFAEGTFRDTGFGHQMGASAVGSYEKGMGMSGGNLWTDIYDGLDDMGHDIGKATNYIFGSAQPKHFRVLGRMIGHKMKGMGMSGGSWWDSLKEGVSDVVGLLPQLAIHAIGGESPATKEVGGNMCDRPVGGAILGNPDPYPVQGNSQRIAGRGRGRPKGSGKKQLLSSNGDLLAMPSPVALANGVPPKAQLRGAYGGAKPDSDAVKKAVMKAVEKKMKGGKNLSGMTNLRDMVMPYVSSVGGDNLSGMTDKRGKGKISKKEREALESVLEKHPKGGKKNLSGMTDKTKEMSGSGDGRKKRAEIVKKVMADRKVSMIQASKIVKEEGLYKK